MPPAPHTPAADAQDHAALIVALDAGDLAGVELRAAESLRASCTGCAALVRDLAAIRGAMTALPVPARRRDYRLTAEGAARLRPSGWRRLLEWLAAPGSAVRPLATGLATLGLVGLLVTTGLPGLLSGLGGSAAAPALAPADSPLYGGAGAPAGSGRVEIQGTSAPTTAPSAAPGKDPGTEATAGPPLVATGAPPPEPSAASSDNGTAVAGTPPSAAPTGEGYGAAGTSDRGPESGKTAVRDGAPAVPLPALVSLALLAVGLALLAGRTLARRRLS